MCFTLCKMNHARITRGQTSSRAILALSILPIACAAFYLRSALSRDSLWPALAALLFLVVGIRNAMIWFSFRSGRWLIEWDGSHIRIKNGSIIEFDSHVADLYRIDQDLRGYYLYPSRDIVYRLRRGSSSTDLETRLDKIQEAQQGAPSNGGQRPSSNSDFPPRRG